MSAVIRLDTVTPRPLKWVWYPRIPLGRLSLLAGHAGRGKSLFALTCAAYISRGRTWPDGNPCVRGSVILLEAEDNLEETIIPRLHAAEADLTYIFTWKERNLTLLKKQIKDIRPQLVILSPLNTYLPLNLNTWHDRSVRAALQPISDLAAETGTGILGIMHPPKRQQVQPIHSIIGSVAFGAVARSVLLLERSPKGLHLLESCKQNLSESIPPIGFRILPHPQQPSIPLIQWEKVSPHASLMPSDENEGDLEEAIDFLKMSLADGPVSSVKLCALARQHDISWRTVARARKLLQVRATQVRQGARSHWMLSLPES